MSFNQASDCIDYFIFLEAFIDTIILKEERESCRSSDSQERETDQVAIASRYTNYSQNN